MSGRSKLYAAMRIVPWSGVASIALFELARVYLPSSRDLPDEPWHVAGITDGSLSGAQVGTPDLFAEHRPFQLWKALGSVAIFIAVDPTLRLLAGEPRYEAMIMQVGVPLRRTASAPRTVSR